MQFKRRPVVTDRQLISLLSPGRGCPRPPPSQWSHCMMPGRDRLGPSTRTRKTGVRRTRSTQAVRLARAPRPGTAAALRPRCLANHGSIPYRSESLPDPAARRLPGGQAGIAGPGVSAAPRQPVSRPWCPRTQALPGGVMPPRPGSLRCMVSCDSPSDCSESESADSEAVTLLVVIQLQAGLRRPGPPAPTQLRSIHSSHRHGGTPGTVTARRHHWHHHDGPTSFKRQVQLAKLDCPSDSDRGLPGAARPWASCGCGGSCAAERPLTRPEQAGRPGGKSLS